MVSSIATPRSNRDDEGVVQAGDAELGWRLYVRPSPSSDNDPVVVYCHANAENVADVEHLAPVLHSAGAAAVFAFDYRGYGVSTGTPSFGTLLADVEHVVAALPGILARFALSGRPLVAYGRSLGAACAVHMASTMPSNCALCTFGLDARPTSYANLRPRNSCAGRNWLAWDAVLQGKLLTRIRCLSQMLRGLVCDSGLMDVRALPLVAQLAGMMGPGAADALRLLPDPLASLDKLRRVTCPLLVLHSEADEIVPFSQGQSCLQACGAADKMLHVFKDGSGHNNITAKHHAVYTRLLTDFLLKASGAPAPAPEDEATLRALSVKELKLRLQLRGLDGRHCIEKGDFVELLLRDS